MGVVELASFGLVVKFSAHMSRELDYLPHYGQLISTTDKVKCDHLLTLQTASRTEAIMRKHNTYTEPLLTELLLVHILASEKFQRSKR